MVDGNFIFSFWLGMNWLQLLSNKMIKEEVYEFVKQNNRHIIIGFGSYGQVKLARKSQSKEFVAIKMIYGKNAQQEISLHKQLNHPRIVKLINYYFDTNKNTTYMVLEYAGGGSLHKYIKTNNVPKSEIKRIFKETCEAVQALHSAKLMHRDLKPENILLTNQREVKLCDFGFASMVGDRKTLCGTYQYMAPEMIQKQPYDFKIDIWALGILLFEMVEGNSPFMGNTPEEVLGEMKKVIMFSDKFDEDQISMIKKILRVKPSNRPTIQQILEHPFCQPVPRVQQKKSIRTTVSSDPQEKPLVYSSYSPNKSMFYHKQDMKLPFSTNLPRNFFQNRPISSNINFYNRHNSSN